MTRISRLIIATSLSILPMTAFAQQRNPVPAEPVTSTQPAHQAKSAETTVPAVKTTHAKLTAKHAVPGKTAEPGKS